METAEPFRGGGTYITELNPGPEIGQEKENVDLESD